MGWARAMHCKLCNTRISPGEKACPNCGADVRGMSGSHPVPATPRRPPGRLPHAAVAAKAAGGPPAAATAMGPAGLRALLADQPELLEPGLRVYRDESGAAAGVAFGTGVGEIDLLATDGRGNL